MFNLHPLANLKYFSFLLLKTKIYSFSSCTLNSQTKFNKKKEKWLLLRYHPARFNSVKFALTIPIQGSVARTYSVPSV